jgi:hypothetical protein
MTTTFDLLSSLAANLRRVAGEIRDELKRLNSIGLDPAEIDRDRVARAALVRKRLTDRYNKHSVCC